MTSKAKAKKDATSPEENPLIEAQKEIAFLQSLVQTKTREVIEARRSEHAWRDQLREAERKLTEASVQTEDVAHGLRVQHQDEVAALKKRVDESHAEIAQLQRRLQDQDTKIERSSKEQATVVRDLKNAIVQEKRKGREMSVQFSELITEVLAEAEASLQPQSTAANRVLDMAS